MSNYTKEESLNIITEANKLVDDIYQPMVSQYTDYLRIARLKDFIAENVPEKEAITMSETIELFKYFQMEETNKLLADINEKLDKAAAIEDCLNRVDVTLENIGVTLESINNSSILNQ